MDVGSKETLVLGLFYVTQDLEALEEFCVYGSEAPHSTKNCEFLFDQMRYKSFSGKSVLHEVSLIFGLDISFYFRIPHNLLTPRP
jgi:hypothetical protein